MQAPPDFRQTETQSRNGSGVSEKVEIGNDLELSADFPSGITRSSEGLPSNKSEGLPSNNNEGLPSNNNEGLLSLKDIEARTGGDNYSKLVRFANQPGIGELLGAVKVAGAKGVRYEPRAAQVFQRLLDAQSAGELTPATAGAWLKAHQASGERAIIAKSQSDNYSSDNGRSDNALTETSAASEQQMSRGLAMIFGPVVSIMQEVRDLLKGHPALQANTLTAPIAPIPDRLLTPEEAAALLACKPRSVGRHVLPVSESPRRYRESDVLHYIAKLEPIQKQETQK